MILGYLHRTEPYGKVTHRHRLGRFSMTCTVAMDLKGHSLRSLFYQAYALGGKLRQSVSATGLATMPDGTPRTMLAGRPRGSNGPCFWVEHPDGCAVHSAELVIDHLRSSAFCQTLLVLRGGGKTKPGISPGTASPRKKQPSGSLGGNLSSPSNAKHFMDTKFLDVYLVLASQPLGRGGHGIMRISLGLDTLSTSPNCPICDTDVFTIDLVSRSGGLAIQSPLRRPNAPRKEWDYRTVASGVSQGIWKDLACRPKGWDFSMPCIKAHDFEPRLGFCFAHI